MSDELNFYEASHTAMGTRFTLAAYADDVRLLAQTAEQVFEEVDRIHAQMSVYTPNSEVSLINREAASVPVRVEPSLFALLQNSLRYSEDTGGAFDITTGPLMKAWGFFRGEGRIPGSEELHAILATVGHQHVRLDPADRTISFDLQGVELDLGGVGKGYAVDRAVTILRENGIRAALLSSGMSSIYALGAPPGEEAWKIILRDPFDSTLPADVLYLKNFSMSTSGNYNKFFRLGEKIYSHIMDPRTGMPVENMLSTTVFAANATDSEALSKLYVLGPEGSRRYLATHPNIQVLFYIPVGSNNLFKRVLIQSASYSLPPDALVKILQ
ncbi:MAG TPA: FAD:protein FMN transferase [Dongiaceae bacterium]|nr:FAD:protein FMN transferase [Dongiaceae bacterium]